MSISHAEPRKATVFTRFKQGVYEPLTSAADWLSWVLVGVFLFVVVASLFLRFNVVQATGFENIYSDYYWAFWYAAWFFLVASTVSPLIHIANRTNQIPIGLTVSVAILHLLVFIAIGTVILSAKFNDNPSAITGMLAAVAAAAMVGVGWYVQYQSNARSQRRAHTFNILMQSRLSKEFQEQLRARDKHFPAGTAVSKDLKNPLTWARLSADCAEMRAQLAALDSKDISADDKSKKIRIEAELEALKEKYEGYCAVKYTLNFYEFMCAGIRCGDLDERLLKDTVKGIAVSLMTDTEEYRKQVKQEQPSAFEHFEYIVNQWK